MNQDHDDDRHRTRPQTRGPPHHPIYARSLHALAPARPVAARTHEGSKTRVNGRKSGHLHSFFEHKRELEPPAVLHQLRRRWSEAEPAR